MDRTVLYSSPYIDSLRCEGSNDMREHNGVYVWSRGRSHRKWVKRKYETYLDPYAGGFFFPFPRELQGKPVGWPRVRIEPAGTGVEIQLRHFVN